MSRYTRQGNWNTSDTDFDPFIVEVADIVDKKTGRHYQDGAYRVTVDGKPAKVGKGGTVPFYGELAWADAQRLANDLWFARRYARSGS